MKKSRVTQRQTGRQHQMLDSLEGMPPMLNDFASIPSAESPTFGAACLSGMQTIKSVLNTDGDAARG